MRQPHQQIQLRFDPPQDLLVRDEELDVAGCPEVAEAGAAEVPDEAYVGDEEAGDEDEDEGRGPGGDFVGADAGSGVSWVRCGGRGRRGECT
jgi:hypothetical protein